MRRLALLAAVAALAGCGGTSSTTRIVQPTLPRALATSLRAQVAGVEAALAAGDGCTAQARAVALQHSVILAENAGRVPHAFTETLGATVNDLAGRIVCTPPPAPAPVHHGPKPHGPHKPHKPGKHGH